MISNRVVRYGYSQTLYRVLSVRLNDNVSCRNNPLHRVDAVAIGSGEPAMWWTTDAGLSSYLPAKDSAVA